jgi:hypothetical protein
MSSLELQPFLTPACCNEDDGCQLAEAAATVRTFHPFGRPGTFGNTAKRQAGALAARSGGFELWSNRVARILRTCGGPVSNLMMLIRSNRRLLVILLSLALLFAQLGMVVHASTHLKNDGDAPTGQVCDYCITSSALQNMGGGDASFGFAVTVAHAEAIETVPADRPVAAAFNAFRSRAPPQIL